MLSEKQTDRVNLTVGRWESLWYRAWAGLNRLEGVHALRASPIVRAMGKDGNCEARMWLCIFRSTEQIYMTGSSNI